MFGRTHYAAVGSTDEIAQQLLGAGLPRSRVTLVSCSPEDKSYDCGDPLFILSDRNCEPNRRLMTEIPASIMTFPSASAVLYVERGVAC